MTISAVVVEDQPVARRYLRRLLDDIEGVMCVGEAADGEAALALIGDLEPDLAFLDIEMPGLSGLEVLQRAQPRPLAVFTTAYDRHAVTAFELQALDYVLKPFGAARLSAAVERARESLRRGDGDQLARAEVALSRGDSVSRVFVHDRGRIRPVLIERVEHVEAQGDYVALWEGGRSHLLRVPIKDLVRRLDPERFFRIHRSHVVNLHRAVEFVPAPDGRLDAVLESGKRVRSSRGRTPGLRARLKLL